MPIEQEEVQLRISRSPRTGWLVIRGEIDAWNVGLLREALAAEVLEVGDVHLDASFLLFCDVTGIRTIVAMAAGLGEGRRLLLHGLDPQLQKVFRVVGWSEMPSLVIDANGVNH
jgi:anti-anti-sigma regulatory factor